MGTSCERNSSYSFVPINLKLCIFFYMVWGCACGLDIIVRSSFFVTFHIVNLVIFHPLYIKPPVSATPLTVLYWLLWNFACVFFMVWGCACDLDVIVRLFFSLFPHCECSHFSPSVYRQWIPCEYNILLIQFYTNLFGTLTMFLHSLKICMCYSYNPWHIFCHFFVLFEHWPVLTSDV